MDTGPSHTAGANRLTKQLLAEGLPAIAIRGNKSQATRQRALDGFRDGSFDVLVATDVASRGIDVDDITHVFQFDLPDDPESYVHRIGRAGRAGRTGVAISFCDTSEGKKLQDVEKIIGQSIPADADHECHCQAAVPVVGKSRSGGGGKGRGKGNRGRSGGRNRNRELMPYNWGPQD